MNKEKTKFKKEVVLLHLARAGEITLKRLFELMWGLGDMTIAMIGTTSKRESAYYMWKAASKERNVHIDLKSKVALSMMVSRLAKEGLIERKKKKITITRKGEKISSQKFIQLTPLPKERKIIVIFDIPEKMLEKRYWLRHELRGMGFEMIQKSVWKGNVVIPKEFLKGIYDSKLKEYVHIFEVIKHGTLMQ
ncbi:MAG: hypothetical protein AB1333_04560 [Patescibacteria group bacterium]